MSKADSRWRLAVCLGAALILGGSSTLAMTPIQVEEPPIRPAADETPNPDANDPVAVWCASEGKKLFGENLAEIVVTKSAKWGTIWRAMQLPPDGWHVVCRKGDFATVHEDAPSAEPRQ